MQKINYKAFIEDNFSIIDKTGRRVAFIFNETQDYYWQLLKSEYPNLQGIRENILKFRQPGFSSLIDAIFTTDFILSALGRVPVITGQIISHKDDETKILFRRVNLFLESFLEKNNIERRQLIKTDKASYLESFQGSELYIGTAGAKTLGRGGTLQNLHWSEVAFYPNTDILNAENLITGAEQQVPDTIGKIFRESTGNVSGDFFSEEYERGKKGVGEFKSRFLGWWIHKQYSRIVPENWEIPKQYEWLLKDGIATKDQCYWHFKKIESAKDPRKAKREYPTDDTEAFLMSGEMYFDSQAIVKYQNELIKPIYEDLTYA